MARALASLLLCFHGAQGFANYMIQETYCSRALVANTMIMGKPAYDSTAQGVYFARNGVKLECGKDSYVPGETLAVHFSGPGQVAFEAKGGNFVGDKTGCGGTRTTGSPTFVTDFAQDTITMKAGFAAGFEAVAITPTCTLQKRETPKPTESPTPAPTPTPTQAPTPAPTTAPTPTPTQSPTLAPTRMTTQPLTPAPTPTSTQSPSPAPIPTPTQAPSMRNPATPNITTVSTLSGNLDDLALLSSARRGCTYIGAIFFVLSAVA